MQRAGAVRSQNSTVSGNQQLALTPVPLARLREGMLQWACYNGNFVTEFILSILAVIRVFFRSRADTAMEVLALRQQVAVLKRKRPRPKLNYWDRIFWTALRRVWSRWCDPGDRQTRDGHRLAPRRLRALLALALPSRPRPA
jgi:hypothetical protein